MKELSAEEIAKIEAEIKRKLDRPSPLADSGPLGDNKHARENFLRMKAGLPLLPKEENHEVNQDQDQGREM